MTRDKKILYITTISLFILLLSCLFIPSNSSRLIAAPLLLLASGIVFYLIKKRSIYSFNKRQVTFVMGIIGVIYVALFYVLGIYFGYRYTYHNPVSSFLKFILPIIIIIISIEIIRGVLLAQESRLVTVLSYFACVFAEISISYSLSNIGTFNRLMDILGLTLIPALVTNLLYHFLSKRFGAIPNIVYRLITTLFMYMFPIVPNMSDSVHALYKILLPLIIYWFISSLYDKKRRYAKKKMSGKATAIITVIVALVMISIVMLISCQFKYRVLVIATDSMTGELNKGDAVLYEAYDGQHIYEGQVIVFNKDDSRIVHRVVKIENINGVTRYYTKGDANDSMDLGYITASNIEGITHLKIPAVGYPTLWFREIFSRVGGN